MTKKEEIKFLIKTNNIQLSSLAAKIGLTSRQLKHLFDESKDLSEDLYSELKDTIELAQVELTLFEEEIEETPSLFDADELDVSIGERIRVFAKKKFGTLTKLANAMNITPQQLNQYTSGNREPGSKILIKLLNLGCDLNWLLGGVEMPESYKMAKLENEIAALKEKLGQIHFITKEMIVKE